MASWLRALPSVGEFFPPTPQAYAFTSALFKWMPLTTVALWTPLRNYQSMGKTSSGSSKANLPGRYAWAIAESVGPLNLIHILYSLPRKLYPVPHASTSLLGTGLPVQHELLGLLYVMHYMNRAIITPLFLAPSMSPIHAFVSLCMATFQFLNSTNLAAWIVYSYARDQHAASSTASIFTLQAIGGIALFIFGLAGNMVAENTLFSLRRGAAKRKAKSEGKATITYDKVYVIPPSEGFFKYILYPHYTLEWLEWTGYWILGGAFGLGFAYDRSAALWFLVNEIGTMLPRAQSGVGWYTNKFGVRPVAGRTGTIPGIV